MTLHPRHSTIAGKLTFMIRTPFLAMPKGCVSLVQTGSRSVRTFSLEEKEHLLHSNSHVETVQNSMPLENRETPRFWGSTRDP